MHLVQVRSLCWAVSPWGQQQVPGIQQLLSSVPVWKWNALFSNLVLEHSSESWMLEMFASFLSSFSSVGFRWPWGNAIHSTKLFSKFSLLSAVPCFITTTKYQRLEKQSWKSTSKKHGSVNKHSQNFWPLPHGQWLHRGSTLTGEISSKYIWRQGLLPWAFTQWSNFFTKVHLLKVPPSQQYHVDQTSSLRTVAGHGKLYANQIADAVNIRLSFWKQPVAGTRTKRLYACLPVQHPGAGVHRGGVWPPYIQHRSNTQFPWDVEQF